MNLHLHNSFATIEPFQQPPPNSSTSIISHQPDLDMRITLNRANMMLALCASWSTQQRKPPDNAGANLVVFRLGVAVTPELGCLTEKTASEPWTVSLPLVRDDLYVQASTLGATTLGFRSLDSSVHEVPDIALQTPSKVLV
jgi:hypothetical protein